MKTLLIPLLCLALIASMSNAFAAAGLPDHYPESYERVGIINEILANERMLVIEGKRVPIRPNLRVFTPRSRFDDVTDLRTGMKVGFDGGRSASDPVSRLWVLPLDYPGSME